VAGYIVFTRLTPAGQKSLRNNPNRLAEVAAQVRSLGVKITRQYATLGDYDFITFIEAPDNVTVAEVAAEISGLGTMRLEVFPVLSMDRFTHLLRLQPYRTEPHRWQTALWARALRRVFRYVAATQYVRRYCRPLTVEGRENLEGLKGPAVIIANHSSHLDTPVVLSALPGRISSRLAIAAAADKFYASRRKFAWRYSLFLNTFPVHRGGGVKQLEYPLSLLERGWSILIFPEGGRSKTGQIGRFKAGPAIMAMEAGVPVVPIYMEGLREILPKGSRQPRPGPAVARIGRPVSLAGAASVAEATVLLENAMRSLAGLPPRQAAAPAAQPGGLGQTTAG
jgi:1-acyl-sn-glycerol-3-phosphate acyltransferase